MDELTAVLRARALVAKVNPGAIPVSVETYAESVGATIRREPDMEPDEAGWSFKNNGRHYICVNANDSPERGRFTVCHEIAHIVLELPSDHKELPWWSYAQRSPDEIMCDVFAAELLLPHHLFKSEVERAEISFGAIDQLADLAEVSTTATGSRFATAIDAPCAFVLSEKGKVRYAARSTSLREAGAWIQPGMKLPRGTLSELARAGKTPSETGESHADLWFADWKRGGTLIEAARHLKKWDQTLTLLWFEDEEVPPLWRSEREEEEALGLRELDGILPWPGKKRRRR